MPGIVFVCPFYLLCTSFARLLWFSARKYVHHYLDTTYSKSIHKGISEDIRRGLLLVAKVVQRLVSEAPFEKEQYMMQLNGFLKESSKKLHAFWNGVLVCLVL